MQGASLLVMHRAACAGLLLALPLGSAGAAFEPMPEGGRQAGLGGAHVALRGDLWSAASNPGLLPSLPPRILSVSCIPALFGLPSMARVSCGVAVQSGALAGGIAASRFGNATYHETSVAISAAVQPSPLLCCGLAVRWYHIGIDGYGSDWTLGLDAGVSIAIDPRWSYGFSIANLNAPSIGECEDPLPVVIRTGLAYEPVTGLRVLVDLSKDVAFPASIIVAAEYRPLTELVMRVGTTTEPAGWSLGVGITPTWATVDYAVSLHPVLGMTHVCSVSVELSRI